MKAKLAVLSVAVIALMAVGVIPASAANNSEQVVFSKTGAFSPDLGPFGFWVWCEADSSNPYQGFCNGSMYFYAAGGAEHVAGTITEVPADSGLYTMSVQNTTGQYPISCTLRNTAPAVSGPHNTVDVSCTAPASGTTSADGSVVRVTGP